MSYENEPLILVADDSPDRLELMTTLLRKAGYSLLTAADGQEAFDIARRARPLVVISDVLMPRASGIELCRWMRADEDLRAVPILLVSALRVDDKSAIEGLQAGADGYLEAPFDPMRLIAKVARLTERARFEAALRESEERYALAAGGSNDGLWDWQLKSGRVYYSKRWKEMLGYGEDEIANEPEEWLRRVHPDDVRRLRSELDTHICGGEAHFKVEHRALHKDGTYRWMLCRGMTVRDTNGRAVRMAGSQTDITEHKLTEERLRHEALHDSLTGLPNRALFMDRLSHALERAKRHSGYRFAVFFVDLDRFKTVNDSLGHLTGDQLLTEVGRRLRACVRSEDTVARFGGDEFTMLIADIWDAHSASLMVERVQLQFAKSCSALGNDLYTSASIGIALSTFGYERPEDILRDADAAMHRAKSHGGGGFKVFDTTMLSESRRVLRLETDLRRTIEQEKLLVHYQPQVELKTGCIVGVEALARWEHPELGTISPSYFVPLAEAAGLIQPLGQAVLRAACRQIKSWQESGLGPLRVAVNLSPHQFRHPKLAETIKSALRKEELDASHLEMEITESSVMQDREGVTAILCELRKAGISVAIDDFGTGYSSLNYLKHLPIDTLKIDKSFLRDMTEDQNDAAIVRAIVAVGHGLNLKVKAEGVETHEQLQLLQDLGCDEAQGYLFSAPLTAGGFEQFMRETGGQKTHGMVHSLAR